MPGDARAFWLASPGAGEIRPATVPEPGPDEVLVRTLHSGVSRGTETLVFRGGVPESQHAAMRAPFQEGDFPAPVKYGYLNVGVVEQGPADLLGRTVFCLYPAPDPVRRAGRCGDRGARRRARRPGGAGRHGGDRGQRALGRGAADRRPDRRGRRRAWSAARWPPSWPGSPARACSWSTRTRPGPGRRRARGRLRAARRRRPATATWSSTPAPPRPGLTRSLELLAAEGTVIELSWYGDREVSVAARRVLPLPPADRPEQPGRRRSPRPGAAAARYADRLASPWTCSPTRPSTR